MHNRTRTNVVISVGSEISFMQYTIKNTDNSSDASKDMFIEANAEEIKHLTL
jgi:hypothetical protein